MQTQSKRETIPSHRRARLPSQDVGTVSFMLNSKLKKTIKCTIIACKGGLVKEEEEKKMEMPTFKVFKNK